MLFTLKPHAAWDSKSCSEEKNEGKIAAFSCAKLIETHLYRLKALIVVIGVTGERF